MINMTEEKNGNTQKRLSISLNPKIVDLLQKFQTKWGVPKSKIVQRALEYLDAVAWEKYLAPQLLAEITKAHSRPDKVLIDVSMIQAVAEEIGEGSEELENKMRDIGKGIYQEYREKGFSSPEKSLEALESKTNLFKITTDSENSFTLVSKTRKMDKYLKAFLEGFLEKTVSGAEVRTEHGKIRIKI